jgi:ABC-2 type transport system permease protein
MVNGRSGGGRGGLHKFIAIAKREYMERVRSKWFLIGTFVAPLIIAAIMILPMVVASRTKPSDEGMNIVILDATGAGLGVRVAAAFAGGIMSNARSIPVDTLSPSMLAAAESMQTSRVVRHEITGYLVVDSATLEGKSARYAGRNASSMADVGRVSQAVRQSVLSYRLEKEGLNPGHIKALVDLRPEVTSDRITDEGRGGSGMGSVVLGYVVAFLLYMMVAIYGQAIMRGVTEEKTTRVAEVVISSVSTNTLLAGKVVGVGLVSITQQLAWVATVLTTLQLRGPILRFFDAPDFPFEIPTLPVETWVVFALFYILGFIFYASLFAAVGATVNSQEDVQQAVQPVMMLLVSSVILVQPILMNPTGTLAKVMSWLPFSSPVLMPLRMSVIAIPWWEVTGVLLLLGLACAGSIWVAARVYRVGMLMYGKRPGLRELIQWVKYA